MSEKEEGDNRRSGTAIGWLAVALIFLPVLYVLSLGPAVRLLRDSPFVGYAAAFYSPLERLAETCPPIGRVLQWYVSLWQ